MGTSSPWPASYGLPVLAPCPGRTMQTSLGSTVTSSQVEAFVLWMAPWCCAPPESCTNHLSAQPVSDSRWSASPVTPTRHCPNVYPSACLIVLASTRLQPRWLASSQCPRPNVPVNQAPPHLHQPTTQTPTDHCVVQHAPVAPSPMTCPTSLPGDLFPSARTPRSPHGDHIV